MQSRDRDRLGGDMTRLGVIGTGQFASYFIAALRRGGYAGDIALSPRNAGIAARLAREHRCAVAASNGDVLDHADMGLLSVRPQHATDTLAPLHFGRVHTVLSAITGTPVDDLRRPLPVPGAP